MGAKAIESCTLASKFTDLQDIADMLEGLERPSRPQTPPQRDTNVQNRSQSAKVASPAIKEPSLNGRFSKVHLFLLLLFISERV